MENKFIDVKCNCDLLVKILCCICIPFFLFLACTFISEPESVPIESFVESTENLSETTDLQESVSENDSREEYLLDDEKKEQITELCIGFARKNADVFINVEVDTDGLTEIGEEWYFPVIGYPASMAEIQNDFLEIVTSEYYDSRLADLVTRMYLETETGMYILQADIPLRYSMDFETIQILSREKDKLLFTIDTDDGLITYQIELAKEDGCWKINMLDPV